MAKIKAMVKALEEESGRPALVRKRTRTPSKKSPGKKTPAASSKKAKLMTLDNADHSYLADLLLAYHYCSCGRFFIRGYRMELVLMCYS